MRIETYDIDGNLIETREAPDPEPDATTVAIDGLRERNAAATTVEEVRDVNAQILDLLDPRIP